MNALTTASITLPITRPRPAKNPRARATPLFARPVDCWVRRGGPDLPSVIELWHTTAAGPVDTALAGFAVDSGVLAALFAVTRSAATVCV